MKMKQTQTIYNDMLMVCSIDCDWCEGAGCEECQKKPAAAAAAPKKVNLYRPSLAFLLISHIHYFIMTLLHYCLFGGSQAAATATATPTKAAAAKKRAECELCEGLGNPLHLLPSKPISLTNIARCSLCLITI
jgi:hypothetical protein